jgi:hypothetical protein
MRRDRSPAQDPSPGRHDRRGAAPSLDGVLELQRMAGNRAVASLARQGAAETLEQRPPPQREESVMATVRIPGHGAIPARAWIPVYDTSQLTELQFESAQEIDTLFKLFMKTHETGKGLGNVTVSWSPEDAPDQVHEATLRDARMTSYQPRGMDASGGEIMVVRWSLGFKSFTKGHKRSSDRRGH